MRSVNYKEKLHQRLLNPRYVRGLLCSAFNESAADGNWEAFGILLQDIIEAHGDRKNFARRVKISRQHLYRLFEKSANPRLKTIVPLLAEFGLRLTLSAEEKTRKRA